MSVLKSTISTKSFPYLSPAGRISLCYALVAGLWITLSDSLLGMLAPSKVLELSMTKGLVFVASTSALLWWLCQRGFRELTVTNARLSQAERLAEGQKDVLEMVARHHDLNATLDALLRFLESQAPDMICSIMLLERNSDRLRHAAAPRLPQAYTRVIDGASMGPSAGSCGTAAYRGENVYVDDIAQSPLWQDYKHLALPHGLRACWSTPLFDARGSVLGTFGVYYGQPGMPQSWHLELIEVARHLAEVTVERWRDQQELQDAKETLEAKVKERTEQLREALERATAADKVKSAFLATMSHELRTPLNSIIGFTSVVLQEMAGPLTEEQSKQLGMVKKSAHHLLALINDVLDISKIEAGQLEVLRAPFALDASIEQVVEGLRPLAERKGLALELDVEPGLPQLESDQRRVEQIVINLVNNALKFTAEGKVTVQVSLCDEGRNVQLKVIDTGIGIQEKDFDQLFRAFRQVEGGLSRRHEGTGLGLAICHRLCRLLGGRVEVESQWGQGSCFTLKLPVESPPNRNPTKETSA